MNTNMNVGAGFSSARIGTEFSARKATKTESKGNAHKAAEALGNNITKTNEDKLSDKAKEFLKNLRKKYGDYDLFVGNGEDDLQALSKSGHKEFSVIFSSEEIERMANDEDYAKEKMEAVEGAVDMSRKICEQEGFLGANDAVNAGNGTVRKISINIDENGNMKIFAELESSSEKQKERIERAREKKAEEKKEQIKADKKNPYRKDDDSIKRTTVEASSMDELVAKIKGVDWSLIPDSKAGDRVDFSV